MRFAMILGCTVATLFAAMLTSPVQAEEVPILQQWKGSYQVANFDHLPKGQRKSGVVGITDEKQWATLWEKFQMHEAKPAEVPEVDFDTNLVVFVRNIRYANAISIKQVEQNEGELGFTLSSTLSARPIGSVACCAAVVVPREGLRKVGNITLP